VAFSLQLHNINSFLQSVFVFAVLGGGGPRWQPLNGADRHALLARRQLERVLAGGNSDGGIQFQPDGSSAPSLAGKQLAVATVERHRLSIVMGSKFVIFVRFPIFVIGYYSAL
jgi:hypothetical protein